MSNPSRGPIIEFGDSIALPDFADIPANKYLVFDFDALYQGDTSNVQLYGVTDSYLSTSSDKLTYDQYLSVNKNANIPIGKWVNIHLVVNSKKDLFLTISDKSGNVLDSRKVTTSGDKFEKFVFYRCKDLFRSCISLPRSCALYRNISQRLGAYNSSAM